MLSLAPPANLGRISCRGDECTSHNLPRISPASFPQIRANLVKIMPSDVTVPTTAPEIIRSNWRANPLAKGAYTFVKVGASAEPSPP